MPFRIRYELNIDWIGAGSGPMGVNTGFVSGQPGTQGGLQGGSGASQTLNFCNSVTAPYPAIVAGSGAGGTLTAGDITAMLVGSTGTITAGSAAMAGDLSAQLNAALGRINGFVTGGG